MGPRALFLLVALGALNDPSCGTDTPAGGINSPCTRSSDCQGGLTCTGAMCVAVDAGVIDAGAVDSPATDVTDATGVD
jgi:hypothetical protein